MLKRLLQSPKAQHALGRAIGGYMALCDRTTRWDEHGRAAIEPYWREGRPVILAIWHGRLMQFHHSWPKPPARRDAHALISRSREGEIIAAAAASIGYPPIRGSSSKAGKDKHALAALREMLKRLSEGDTIAVTPDGPRGPRMRAAAGVVQLAKLSGAPIVPLAWAKSSVVALNSWDRFMLPLPFGRGIFHWGEPMFVPREAGADALEVARLALEAELIRLTLAADAAMGRPAIDPAPARVADASPAAAS